MNIIPLIHLKKRKILNSKYIDYNSIKEQLDHFKDDLIYLLDHDGIEKNKPNLCLYQKLSKNFKLWADGGPRVLGDVVDSVIAGADAITIRQKLWQEIPPLGIKELTENKIYSDVNLKNYLHKSNEQQLIHDVDGLIIFENKNKIENDFKYSEYLKGICTRYETYVYALNKKDMVYWKKLGIAGLLIDLENVKEYKIDGF